MASQRETESALIITLMVVSSILADFKLRPKAKVIHRTVLWIIVISLFTGLVHIP